MSHAESDPESDLDYNEARADTPSPPLMSDLHINLTPHPPFGVHLSIGLTEADAARGSELSGFHSARGTLINIEIKPFDKENPERPVTSYVAELVNEVLANTADDSAVLGPLFRKWLQRIPATKSYFQVRCGLQWTKDGRCRGGVLVTALSTSDARDDFIESFRSSGEEFDKVNKAFDGGDACFTIYVTTTAFDGTVDCHAAMMSSKWIAASLMKTRLIEGMGAWDSQPFEVFRDLGENQWSAKVSEITGGGDLDLYSIKNTAWIVEEAKKWQPAIRASLPIEGDGIRVPRRIAILSRGGAVAGVIFSYDDNWHYIHGM